MRAYIRGKAIGKIFSWRKKLHTRRNHSRNWMRDVIKHEKVTITAFADAGEEEKEENQWSLFRDDGRGRKCFSGRGKSFEIHWARIRRAKRRKLVELNYKKSAYKVFPIICRPLWWRLRRQNPKKDRVTEFLFKFHANQLGASRWWGWRWEGTNYIEFHIWRMTASGSHGDFILVTKEVPHFSHNIFVYKKAFI